MLLTVTFEFAQKESLDQMVDMLDRAAKGEPLTVVDQMIMRAVAGAFRTGKWETYKHNTNPLTKRQRDVFNYVSNYIAMRGYAPSRREICDHLGLRSEGTVQEHVDNLVDKGYLRRGERYAERGLALTAPV
jgi:DNA-binding NarL/FixJ family response regulator